MQSLNASYLVPLMEKLTPKEDYNPTYHPAITTYRTTHPAPPYPILYGVSLVVIVQGMKKVYAKNKTYQYDPSHYLLVTSQVPMLCEVIQDGDKPILTMRLDIDIPLLSELVLEMSDAIPDYKMTPLTYSVCTGELSPQLLSSLQRLMECLQDSNESRMLARALIREVYFHLLNGPNGNALRRLAYDVRYSRINDVIHHINLNYASPLRVDDLAQMASMSISTFHHNFKAITSASPLQYLKNIRLTKARLLMLLEGQNAGQAANAVGYESVSQFSREFSRFFGEPPAKQVRKMMKEASGHPTA